jgi:hypothetical protein
MTAHPGLHNLYSTGSSGTICFRATNTGLADGFGTTRFTTRLLDRFALRRTTARRPAALRVAARRASARRVKAIVLLAIRNFAAFAANDFF